MRIGEAIYVARSDGVFGRAGQRYESAVGCSSVGCGARCERHRGLLDEVERDGEGIDRSVRERRLREHPKLGGVRS